MYSRRMDFYRKENKGTKMSLILINIVVLYTLYTAIINIIKL